MGMDEQVSYVGRTAKLKHLPSEHFAGGGVLTFGSDYPHYESWFPHSIDKILEWPNIGKEVRQKLFWGNATRCFKQT
jgi:predicted TIM-barrel fold metal-dependent hydrolase